MPISLDHCETGRSFDTLSDNSDFLKISSHKSSKQGLYFIETKTVSTTLGTELSHFKLIGLNELSPIRRRIKTQGRILDDAEDVYHSGGDDLITMEELHELLKKKPLSRTHAQIVGLELLSSMVAAKIYGPALLNVHRLFTNYGDEHASRIPFNKIVDLFLGCESLNESIYTCGDRTTPKTHECDVDIIIQMLMMVLYVSEMDIVSTVMRYFDFYDNYDSVYNKIDRVFGVSIYFYSYIINSKEYDMSSRGRYFINDSVLTNTGITAKEIKSKLNIGAEVIIINYDQLKTDIFSIISATDVK